tara:strand:+ start:368 stop:586 length:219 start_codon:yes stop_codon:yes gene_type:complete
VAKFVGGFSKISKVGIGDSDESKNPADAINNPKNKEKIGIINIHEKKKIIILIFCLIVNDVINLFNLFPFNI